MPVHIELQEMYASTIFITEWKSYIFKTFSKVKCCNLDLAPRPFDMMKS